MRKTDFGLRLREAGDPNKNRKFHMYEIFYGSRGQAAGRWFTFVNEYRR